MIEVLVASALIIVISLGVLLMLDTATSTTAAGKQRDVANAVAQEVTERATAGRYVGPTPAQIASSTNLQGTNDMVDISGSSGPADRIAALMQGAGSTVGGVSPATPTSGAPAPPQSWTVTRRGTTYTVTYLACTSSDVVSNVRIDGPADCSNFSGTGCTETALLRCSYRNGQPPPAPSCTLAGSVANPTSLPALTVRLNLGLQLCVGSLLGKALATSLCSAVGNSTGINTLTSQLLGSQSGLTNLLGSGLSTDVSLCPATQIDSALLGPKGTVASSTRVSVNVTWTDSGRRETRQVSQTSLIRRAST